MDTSNSDYKRIHIVNYYYKFKKDRVYILAEKNKDGIYELPNHYLTQKERFDFKDNSFFSLVDNKDIEVKRFQFSDVHYKRKNTEWVDLKDLAKYTLLNNEEYDVFYDIFYIFLDKSYYSNPFDITSNAYMDISFDSIRERYLKIFDDILQERCKLRYIKRIKDYLTLPYNGLIHFDCIYHPMKNELLEKELETLEHFKMEKIKVNSYAYSIDYEYEDVPIETFGGRIEPINWIYDNIDNEIKI